MRGNGAREHPEAMLMRWQYEHRMWGMIGFGSVTHHMVHSGLSPCALPYDLNRKFPLCREADVEGLFEGGLKVNVMDEFGIRVQYFDLQWAPISSVKSIGFRQVIGDKSNLCHASISIRIHPDPYEN